jgi:2,4-dienoyl-CoA reductase-like NADH-dependent reductase (Old Yellow Enzyme family)
MWVIDSLGFSERQFLAMKSQLFQPLKIRGIEMPNRIFVSPMCQYSAVDGLAQAWHLVHLGSRALGGAGLVMAEATAIAPEGRISPGCLGLWNEAQALALKSIARFISEQGSIPAIQLAHAGRKASSRTPLQGQGPLLPAEGAWKRFAPSARAYQSSDPVPQELSLEEIENLVAKFVAATQRAVSAGFQVIEIHMAHGYLLHEFLSPLSNLRKDKYGGTLENRMHFPLVVAREVRNVLPKELPLFVRISATDWIDGGWDFDQSIIFCKELSELGVDFVDVSSGGLAPQQKISMGPGYQVPLTEAIRRDVGKKCGLLTGAVGLITKADQAEEILQQGRADAVFLARELLRNPTWPLQAAQELEVDVKWPWQYERAKPFPCI